MIAGARDTVNIDESTHYIYKELTEGTDAATVPFKTMKDVFLWAAALGYKRGERRPISGKKLIIFRVAQFSSQVDMPIIKSLALSYSYDIKILIDNDYVLSIVEEYANAGIHEMKDRLIVETGQPLWNLVSTYEY